MGDDVRALLLDGECEGWGFDCWVRGFNGGLIWVLGGERMSWGFFREKSGLGKE